MSTDVSELRELVEGVFSSLRIDSEAAELNIPTHDGADLPAEVFVDGIRACSEAAASRLYESIKLGISSGGTVTLLFLYKPKES